jgi:hypothetical protein
MKLNYSYLIFGFMPGCQLKALFDWHQVELIKELQSRRVFAGNSR